ncbi:MAG: copper homeostasis protein CutC [Gemmatimonadota bacterium]|nr:copper homeostasis protein CutC [Gemmatimonadota bacterium]
MPPPAVLVEAAVVSVEEAAAALEAGAGRLELCRDLPTGGLTPGWSLLQAVRERMAGEVPVFAMIRPRDGDFVYTRAEVAAMRKEIREAERSGADGVVLGCLRPDGRVDSAALAALVDEARGLPVTFHRAFDATPSAIGALEDVIRAGVARVLTSGHAPTASLGADVLAELVRVAAGRVTVLPGGTVRGENVRRLVASTAAVEVHARAAAVSGIRAALDRRD